MFELLPALKDSSEYITYKIKIFDIKTFLQRYDNLFSLLSEQEFADELF